jgi:hypothetical protein
VGEGLRIVAQLSPGARVDFLGEQPERAGPLEQFGEQVSRPVLLPGAGERLHEPEAARQERALLTR